MSQMFCIFSFTCAVVCTFRLEQVQSLALPLSAIHPSLLSYAATIERTSQSGSTLGSKTASALDGSLLLASLNDIKHAPGTLFPSNEFQKDQIVRILDANTIKLQKNGVVSLAGVRYPSTASNFQFSECSSYSPTYKLRQLIPANTAVFVKVAGTKPQAVLVRQNDAMVVNEELVKSGFAKVKPIYSPELEGLLDSNALKAYEDDARRRGVGIFQRCDDGGDATFVAEFEPLELDVETRWGDDGGTQILKQKESISQVPPKNPGDVKGCSDFEFYEDALRWFENYKPYFGDVAKL